jgi:ABC-type ATPase involved in cell division
MLLYQYQLFHLAATVIVYIPGVSGSGKSVSKSTLGVSGSGKFYYCIHTMCFCFRKVYVIIFITGVSGSGKCMLLYPCQLFKLVETMILYPYQLFKLAETLYPYQLF